jgi:hypothetical protein
MRRSFGGHVFDGAVPEGAEVDAGEQGFALTEYDGRNGQMDLVHVAGQHELPYGFDPAADLDVCVPGSFARAGQSHLDPVGYEVKGRPTQHL